MTGCPTRFDTAQIIERRGHALDLFERDEIEGLTDETTMAQLASLQYEINSQGRIKIESKEKAGVRGVASPDRAEALMLALGKPFERRLPDYMLRDLAADQHQMGDSPEVIADHLEASDDEVQAWLQGKRLAERAGPSRARENIYTADQYDAATFERWNIVNRVVPDEKLESETRGFAERLASGATLAYAAGKKIVRAYLERGVRAADALVDEIAPALFETADMRAGVDGLIEHGPRQFRNKVIFEGR